MSERRFSRVCAMAIAAVVLGTGRSYSQSVDGTAIDNGIAEIVVTATKREQSLSQVPMTVNAATGAELAERGITDVSDLTKLVPGFTYTESAFATPVYTLRGVGFYDTSLAAKPSVSVY